LLPLGGTARSAKGAPVSAPAPRLDSPRRAALLRGAAFFALWMILMQSAKPADLLVGAFTTVAATWVSLRLLRPTSGCLRFGALLTLVPHFLWESVLAGIDVARRVFDPRLPLRPGFVDCPLDFPPGFARNTFSTITSLLPGSVPAGESDGQADGAGAGALVYHCLDTTQPVVEQLWKEERLLARALVAGRRHD
jgi:multicomponent Na+:H+ antiporter subunit E